MMGLHCSLSGLTSLIRFGKYGKTQCIPGEKVAVSQFYYHLDVQCTKYDV